MTTLDDFASVVNGNVGSDRTAVLAAVGRFDRRAMLAAHHALAIPGARRTAIHVVEAEHVADELTRSWMACEVPLPLDLVYASGSVAEALRDTVRDELVDGAERVVVVVARQALSSGWQRVLHDQTADAIAAAVANERDVLTAVVAVPVPGGTCRAGLTWPDHGAALHEGTI